MNAMHDRKLLSTTAIQMYRDGNQYRNANSNQCLQMYSEQLKSNEEVIHFVLLLVQDLIFIFPTFRSSCCP